jgi:hypothetical protein
MDAASSSALLLPTYQNNVLHVTDVRDRPHHSLSYTIQWTELIFIISLVLTFSVTFLKR